MKFKIDMSKQANGERENTSAKELIYGLAGVMLALSVIIYPIKKYQGTYLPLRKKIAAEKDKLAALEEKNQQINQKLTEINNKRALLSPLKNGEIYWAEKLVSLGRLMPKHMWLTSLYEEGVASPKKQGPTRRKKEKTLVIKGGILLVPEEGYLERIARFTKDLNNSSSFNETIKSIELIYVKPSPKKEDAKRMVFELRGKFKS